MEVVESVVIDGQEDWQRVAEMIRSIARRELVETAEKDSTQSRRETW